jgi:hypothetical protein
MQSTRYFFCHIPIKVEFSRDFQKISNIKFHENPPVGAQLLRANNHTDGRTDRQIERQRDRRDEAKNRFSQFCKKLLKR